MDKTINLGSLEISPGKFYWYVYIGDHCIMVVNPTEVKTTLEYAQEMDSKSFKTPDELDEILTARESVKLYKFALEQGMNEHEDVTYWLRDYVVEKIREAQAIS